MFSITRTISIEIRFDRNSKRVVWFYFDSTLLWFAFGERFEHVVYKTVFYGRGGPVWKLRLVRGNNKRMDENRFLSVIVVLLFVIRFAERVRVSRSSATRVVSRTSTAVLFRTSGARPVGPTSKQGL